MTRSFKILFTVDVKHNFYEDEVSNDIEIVPTKECAQLFKDGRMHFRTTSTGIVVLYRVDDDDNPFVNLNGDVTFTFALYLRNTNNVEFLNFTDFTAGSKTYNGKNVLHFTNGATDGDLDFGYIDHLEGPVFTYRFPFDLEDTGDSATLTVKNEDGLAISVLKDTEGDPINPPYAVEADPGGIYRQSVDFNERPKGLYTFEADGNPGQSEEELVYVDEDLYTKNVFGLLTLNYAAEDLYSNAEAFDMRFVRKETTWKYFIVNKSGNIDLDAYDLGLTDTSNDGSNPSNPYEDNTFTKGTEPDPNIAVDGFDTVVFTSDQLIPYYESPKLGLNLTKAEPPPPPNPPQTTVIKNLPNPPLKGVTTDTSEVYIYI